MFKGAFYMIFVFETLERDLTPERVSLCHLEYLGSGERELYASLTLFHFYYSTSQSNRIESRGQYLNQQTNSASPTHDRNQTKDHFQLRYIIKPPKKHNAPAQTRRILPQALHPLPQTQRRPRPLPNRLIHYHHQPSTQRRR